LFDSNELRSEFYHGDECLKTDLEREYQPNK